MLKHRFPAASAVLASLLGVAAGDTLEQVDPSGLLDPATREAAVAGMPAGRDAPAKHQFKRRDFRLVTCSQGSGQDPLHLLLVDFGEMVFTRPPRPGAYGTDGLDALFPPEKNVMADISSPAGPGLERLEKYVITFFGPDGREIRPFKGNNMINSGYLTHFNRDGILDRLDPTNYGVDDALDVQVLELRSVEREPKHLLNVLYNWHPRRTDTANIWDYECFDDDKDGLIEIGFGPKDQPRRRVVVFRWDKPSSTYVAENRSDNPHLRVLANTDPWKQLKEIKTAGGHHYPLVAENSAKAGEASPPPRPFQFQSLKGRGDAEIVRAMGGKPAADSFHPADAPDTRLPEGFWTMDPKAAALAFAEANRTPAHRKMVRIAIDDRDQVRPPESGWMVYDFKSSSCYTSTTNLTVLRFGIDNPYIFQSGTSMNGMVGTNPLADRAGHALRLIQVSREEARFLSDTVFWLDRIRSRSSKEDRFAGGGMRSTADGRGTVDFLTENQQPRRSSGTLWNGPSVAARWTDEFDQDACVSLADHLLSVALPRHLTGRWDDTPFTHRNLASPLADRVKPREDSDACDELTFIVLAALERHKTDPWPAAALAQLVNCAGDTGLSNTLPELEKLHGKLPPPGDSETEFRTLEEKFKGQFVSPNDDEGKNQWERLQSLRLRMSYDIPCQLREPLARAIKQLRALYQKAPLIKMAETNDASAAWALQQLQIHHPEYYADTIIASFRDADPKARGMIFATLAAAYPPGARLLRETLTDPQPADLAIELARFEIKDEPALAKSRIPALIQIFKDTSNTRDYGERGPAIELLSVLPLDAPQQAQFEALLLSELKTPRRNAIKLSILPWIIPALIKLPDPDRHWDALMESSGIATEHNEFSHLLDALSTLALAKPQIRKAQLAGFIQPHFTHHGGNMNDLFLTALALDLRQLVPEIARLASSGPEIEEGKCANGWGGGFTGPGNERYHLARHVTALWLEADADTRARMWTAMVLASPYDYSQQTNIAAALRKNFRRLNPRLLRLLRRLISTRASGSTSSCATSRRS